MIDKAEKETVKPVVIEGKLSWGFLIDGKVYGSEVDIPLEIKGKDLQARREIRGKVAQFMAMFTKHVTYSLQKLITQKTDLEDEVENLNKIFVEKGKGVSK